MSPFTVLVVDNDSTILALLTRALVMLGIHVVIAQNGLEAVSLIQKQQFSVVLLDVDMPGIDGPEMLKRLHAVRPLACVFMTAGSAYPTDELLALGACDVIRKPFGSFDTLVQVLKDCFDKETLRHATHASRQPHLEQGPQKKPQE